MGSIAAGLTSSGRRFGELSPRRVFASFHSPDELGLTYDYLIVGAGSAGCVLAHRLAQAGRSVLLIEAGGAAGDSSLPSSSHQTGLSSRAVRLIGAM